MKPNIQSLLFNGEADAKPTQLFSSEAASGRNTHSCRETALEEFHFAIFVYIDYGRR
jgi:hypothetical protein